MVWYTVLIGVKFPLPIRHYPPWRTIQNADSLARGSRNKGEEFRTPFMRKLIPIDSAVIFIIKRFRVI